MKAESLGLHNCLRPRSEGTQEAVPAEIANVSIALTVPLRLKHCAWFLNHRTNRTRQLAQIRRMVEMKIL